MKSLPTFKILILSFNHPDLTAKTLRSVLAFHQASDIALVHNGSLPEHRQKLKDGFKAISHIEIDQNKGFTGGANFGLKKCFENHEWIYFITNDCELVKPLTIPDTCGFFAPTIFRRKVGVIDSMGGKLNLAIGKLHHCKTKNDFEKNNIFSKPYIPGTAFILHRDYFFKVGEFDETLHTYWEDVDFSLRALKLGLKLSMSEENALVHKIGKTCHKDPFYTKHLFWKNRMTISRKHSQIFRPILETKFFLEKLSLRR